MIKVISLFVVLIPFVTLSQAELKCGIHKNDLQTRIIGSETVRNHAFPWMTFLMLSYYEPDGKLKGYTCGASLINKQWLLTSAHCLAITKSSKFASGVAILGTNIVSIRHQSKDSIQINFGPKNTFLNNGYNPRTDESNIALLKMPKPLNLEKVKDFISPICLPARGVPMKDDICFSSGWGEISPFPFDQKYLRRYHESVISFDQCKKYFWPATKNSFCTSNRGHTDCTGDFGGPLQCLNKDKAWTIEGVYNIGYGFCDNTSVFTKVENYLDWIEDTMDEN